MSINLLPQDLRYSHEKREQRSLSLVALILYGCLFLVSNGFLYYQIQSKKTEEAAWHSLQSEYRQAEETLAQLNDELARLTEEKNALEAFFQKERERAALVSWIMNHLPPSIRLQRLQAPGEGWISLSGQSLFLEDIKGLVGILTEQSKFQEVVLSKLEVERETGVKSFLIDLKYHHDQ